MQFMYFYDYQLFMLNMKVHYRVAKLIKMF